MREKRAKVPAKSKASKTINGLLGVGLDNDDGHTRRTVGEKFAIVGGSQETHERMTETVVKTFEELKHRGRELERVSRAELEEILHKSTPR